MAGDVGSLVATEQGLFLLIHLYGKLLKNRVQLIYLEFSDLDLSKHTVPTLFQRVFVRTLRR